MLRTSWCLTPRASYVLVTGKHRAVENIIIEMLFFARRNRKYIGVMVQERKLQKLELKMKGWKA